MGNDIVGFIVAIFTSEEGFAVSAPELPGCWSQGETEAEAMENIRDAIREYLAASESPVARMNPLAEPEKAC